MKEAYKKCMKEKNTIKRITLRSVAARLIWRKTLPV